RPQRSATSLDRGQRDHPALLTIGSPRFLMIVSIECLQLLLCRPARCRLSELLVCNVSFELQLCRFIARFFSSRHRFLIPS
ncbi:MAG: hypothetical protein ACYDCL_23195, partial [Myxococcales bacterium]